MVNQYESRTTNAVSRFVVRSTADEKASVPPIPSESQVLRDFQTIANPGVRLIVSDIGWPGSCDW